MDKILLGLFIVVAGSLLLPAMRLARVFVPRRARPETAGQETIREFEKQIDDVPLVPSADAGGYQFRPLTPEEKKEFENSLDAKRKRSFKPRLYLPGSTIVP